MQKTKPAAEHGGQPAKKVFDSQNTLKAPWAQDPSAIPEEMRARNQWVIWRYLERAGKRTKVPHTTMGYRASSTNPEHWSRFEHAVRAASRPGFSDGIGYVFSPDDPYCGIDLDHIYQSDADECAAWAQGILRRFADTYLEESPSGTGIKIWCRAQLRRNGKWPMPNGTAIELYDRSRFFCLTGRSNGITSIQDHQADIDALVENLGQSAAAPGGVIGDVILYHTQHLTLVSLAGTMWRRGMSVEAIEAALQVTNARQCEQPGTPEAIRKIAQSAERWQR